MMTAKERLMDLLGKLGREEGDSEMAFRVPMTGDLRVVQILTDQQEYGFDFDDCLVADIIKHDWTFIGTGVHPLSLGTDENFAIIIMGDGTPVRLPGDMWDIYNAEMGRN